MNAYVYPFVALWLILGAAWAISAAGAWARRTVDKHVAAALAETDADWLPEWVNDPTPTFDRLCFERWSRELAEDS